jgi:hypothetical protein
MIALSANRVSSRSETRFGLKATVEIRGGCRSLNVNRLFVTDQARPFAGYATECERVSSGRLRGGYHVRVPAVENMIGVATYWKFGRPKYGAHPFPASAEAPGALSGYIRRVRRAKN